MGDSWGPYSTARIVSPSFRPQSPGTRTRQPWLFWERVFIGGGGGGGGEGSGSCIVSYWAGSGARPVAGWRNEGESQATCEVCGGKMRAAVRSENGTDQMLKIARARVAVLSSKS